MNAASLLYLLLTLGTGAAVIVVVLHHVGATLFVLHPICMVTAFLGLISNATGFVDKDGDDVPGVVRTSINVGGVGVGGAHRHNGAAARASSVGGALPSSSAAAKDILSWQLEAGIVEEERRMTRRRRCHFATQFLAVVLVLGGFAFVVSARFQAKQPVGLRSFHSIFGVVIMTVVLLQGVLGLRKFLVGGPTSASASMGHGSGPSSSSSSSSFSSWDHGPGGSALVAPRRSGWTAAGVHAVLSMMLPSLGLANIILGLCRLRPRVNRALFVPLMVCLFVAFAAISYAGVHWCCAKAFPPRDHDGGRRRESAGGSRGGGVRADESRRRARIPAPPPGGDSGDGLGGGGGGSGGARGGVGASVGGGMAGGAHKRGAAASQNESVYARVRTTDDYW